MLNVDFLCVFKKYSVSLRIKIRKMKIRRAEKKDIPRIHLLLTQVNNVHANGRPDLFKSGNRKYTDEQLEIIWKLQ